MRNITTLLFGIFALMQVSIADAQNINNPKPEKNVPAIVVERFNQKFPSHDPVWFSQYQGRYDQKLVFEGRFIFDRRYSSAIYDTDGNFLAFAATVERIEIPEQAIKYMNENFPGYPIVDAMLVTRGNAVTFEIGIYIDNQFVVKVFSKNGDFIKSTKG